MARTFASLEPTNPSRFSFRAMNTVSLDIATLSERYRSKSLTPTQLVLEVLQRISDGDPKIWISVDSEKNLLRQAGELEDKQADSLPLYGIPFAIKDNIDVANLPTTAACPDFRSFPGSDATVVSLLRNAGAIPIGKTNLDQFATGLVGTRSPYGIPDNPFNPKYIPGGSSSGSAVSVALGQVSFSLGTDTAGSGRVPACFNNLIGLKPTKGSISTLGVFPACRSLDCVSIFALNAHDAQKVFNVAAIQDFDDPYSREVPKELDSLSRIPKDEAVFGVPDPLQLKFFGNESYQELYLESIRRLESLGHTRKTIDFSPFLEAAKLLYEGPWVAERYWATKDLIENSPDSLLPTTRKVIEKGNLGTAVETFDAMYKLQASRKRAASILSQVDFIATPTAGTHYRKTEIESNPIQLNSNLGYYTNFMNLLDLSAIAVPTGFTEHGLPFGVTLFANAFHDEYLLEIANRLHSESGLNLGKSEVKRHPELAPAEYDSVPIAVCGAHMSGLPLNSQLRELGSVYLKTIHTSPRYRLFALPNTTPPKPGLVKDAENGGPIEIELWNLPKTQWSTFIGKIPPPLGLGNIELEDGSYVKGFLCEAWAAEGARDITDLGSWRKFVNSSEPTSP